MILMAIWQFELQPVPAKAALIEGAPAIHLTDTLRDTISLGLSAAARASLIEIFNALLPAQTVWSSGLMIWGSTRGTDIQLLKSDDGTDTIHVRIDARSFSHQFIDRLCAIASDFRWVFITDRGGVLQPNRVAVLRALLNSPARAYVADSERVIEEAADRIFMPA